MSVRRSVRRSTEDGTRYPAPPERLRPPAWVEDWVDPDEAPPEWWWLGTIISDDRPVEIMSWLSITAMTRMSKAQIAWAKEVEMPWHEFCSLHGSAYSQPKWRDWRAFCARRPDLRELLDRPSE